MPSYCDSSHGCGLARIRRLAVSCYSSHEVRMFFNSLTEGSEWEYVQTVTLTDQSQGR